MHSFITSTLLAKRAHAPVFCAQSICCEMESWQTHEMSVYINDKTAVFQLEKSCSIHRHT